MGGLSAWNNYVYSYEAHPSLPHKVEHKHAWKVLSDPSAEERHWVAACKVVKGATPNKSPKSKHRPLSDRSHAWATSVLGTFGGLGVFFFGFTALNEMTSALSISDELTTFSTWFSYVLAFISWPAGASALVGFMQRGDRPEVKHSWLVPLSVPLLMAIGACVSRQDLLPLPATIAGIAVARLSYRIGRLSSKWWRQLGSQSKLFGPHLWATCGLGLILAMYLAGSLSRSSGPHVQPSLQAGISSLYMLSFLSLMAGIETAHSCKSRKFATQLGAVLTMQLPMMALLGSAIVAGLFQTGIGLFTGVSGTQATLVSLLCMPLLIVPSTIGTGIVYGCKSIRANRTDA